MAKKKKNSAAFIPKILAYGLDVMMPVWSFECFPGSIKSNLSWLIYVSYLSWRILELVSNLSASLEMGSQYTDVTMLLETTLAPKLLAVGWDNNILFIYTA